MAMEVLKDGSERVVYDFDDFRAYVQEGLLSYYPNYAADNHWHDDLEFMLIRTGVMQYRVNDHVVTMHPGEGIFVNSRQLHYGYSDTHEESSFICIRLHPELLCASELLRRDYVQPILQGGIAYVLLTDDAPWKIDLMDELRHIASTRGESTAPLHIQQSFYRIWLLLYEHAPWSGARGRPDHRLSIVKTMVTLIHNNYMDKLTLDDIAASASVSKNTCLNLFHTYLNDTPGNYLIAYRAKIAAELLLDTDRTIADIALSVGFASPSHLTETFKKLYGVTPKEYRTARWRNVRI